MQLNEMIQTNIFKSFCLFVLNSSVTNKEWKGARYVGANRQLAAYSFEVGYFRAMENDNYSAKDTAYAFRQVRGGSVSPEWEEGFRDSNRVRQIFCDEADQFKMSIEAHESPRV